MAIHVIYCLAGLALIVSQSVIIFNVIKYIGAGYLFYVGYHALKSRGFDEHSADINPQESRVSMSAYGALKSGFITNLFNPKATLFFLALFTQVLSPDIAFVEKLIFGMTCILMTMLWFSFVAVVLTTPKIRAAFLKMSKWVDRVCGALFIALGLKLVFTRLS